MITAVIIEDEPRSKNLLQQMILNYSDGINIVGTAEKVQDAITLIKKVKPKLVFLDIELTDGKGFDVLDHFSPTEFVTIFITGYDNYGIEAMKREALDYILKPLSLKELLSAIKKAKKRIKEQGILSKIYHTKDIDTLQNEVLIVKDGKQHKVLPFHTILYLEAYGKYTKWHTLDHEVFITRNALSYYMNFLSDDFFQIHRSYIINLQHLISWEEGAHSTVTIYPNHQLSISTRKKTAFLKHLQKVARLHQK
ncbi:response regulator transcription factor [Kordia sp. YSTF-M3]|uniref:Response regulator transcription factor n=1 Tax=Kordia aestuariivivens TaxID=2759037 RepID=A0ABR7Q9P3_9FLAO|nr:LytTR family DNA-binding domain-containing protein [Kordia aestuariivivens]MBC8755203.1 response regulator transcription factor [Kordia aestuariivivens]